MPKKPKKPQGAPGMPPQPNVFAVLKPYGKLVGIVAFLSVVANGFTLWLPKILSSAIDDYAHHKLQLHDVAWHFGLFSLAIFVLTALQTVAQTVASEQVARDLRTRFTAAVSRQTYSFVQEKSAAVLLTNLTSDIDSVKLFVSQAVASIISSLVLLVGAAVLLLQINWKLGLGVLTIVPVIGVTFNLTLQKVRALFTKSRVVIDKLNRVINESILGAALVRVLNSQAREFDKFVAANEESRGISLSIVRLFAGLIPLITFFGNVAIVIILGFGGHLILGGSMSIGDFTAFNSYLSILIFPIILLGFMGNVIAQATASYGRIAAVLDAPEPKADGTLDVALKGDIELKGVSLAYGQKHALKDLSFKVKAGQRVAIIGPTAAGKTQLLYLLTALNRPSKGEVLYDGRPLTEYDPQAFHRQVGMVFQDSVTFNMSIRENIAFTQDVSKDDLEKAIATAELTDFLATLPKGIETIVSERGSSLSGGQKQRVMLARALALNPKVLLLDDFTARVDAVTEQKILRNLRKNYPDLTLISVTQKISSIEEYDEILLLMEGELLASGTHAQLLKKSPEYQQIYTSQQSTNEYELRAD
jgi:ATP-binding cassette, subfamily B, bacterial